MERQHMNGENGTSNGVTPKILALEIEADDEDEERQSLIHESQGINTESKEKEVFMGRNAHGMRRRGWGGDNGSEEDGLSNAITGNSVIQGLLRGDLMSHAVYHLRNALLLGLLAFFVLMVLEWEGGILRSEKMEKEEPAEYSPHTMSFGGKNNLAHNLNPNKKKKPKPPALTPEEQEENIENEILGEAVDIAMRATWDLSWENKRNEQAHYLHDPNLSPFASELYMAEQDVLDARQRNFTFKMIKVVEEFGVWNNPNFEEAHNLKDSFFDEFNYRDVPLSDFPDEAWQKDRNYMVSFIDQAMALVEAVKEGIMQEYNHPNPDDEEKHSFAPIIGDHEFIEGEARDKNTKTKLKGVAFLPQQSWDGLVRKLLHAMITTDHFYVVVVGKDNTYRANNFAQTQIMQFNYIMEPVFNKLGMTLISRHMGMAASPIVGALGGADIYGETDVLWHVQGHTEEEKPGEFDLLQKQTVMSGERVPVIFSPSWEELVQGSKGKAWVGNIQPGYEICEKTTMEVLPTAPACHGVHCDTQAWESGKCHVYDSVCWELRNDFTPPDQHEDVGDKDQKFAGFRQHQLEGRKMTLLFLHALSAALSTWQDQLKQDRTPLPLDAKLWHVGDTYEDIRKTVMSLDRTPGEVATVPLCEQLLKDLDPRICHIPMHARTEWTPRVIPKTHRLLGIVNNLIDGPDDGDIYDGPDLVPLAWQVPTSIIDVHMIAIASNGTEQEDDDGLFYDDDGFYGGDDFLNRKLAPNGEKNSRSSAGKKEKREERRLKKHPNNPKPAPPPPPPEKVATPAPEPATNPPTEPPTAPPTAPPPSIDPLTGKTMIVTEGSGWTVQNVPSGFCDGSAQSRCNRHANNLCLLANHNFYPGTIVGTPRNNWLTMRVSDVKHGIILARLEFGADLPSDFMFDFAIGDQLTSVPLADLNSFSREIVSDLRIYPLLLDKDRTMDGSVDGVDYEVAIRIRSAINPNCTVGVSHIYFA
ncbi:expressed unknown protein [Seminavis robusta]|uniref:Uncharacterized protein n=1 Tax=Seminavis robusta TaxID=568900 RepID=A0A9N8HUJ6_9STRA|nr:expressed unknown protein [Seminavis robusta]|eukprot:Sro1391_g268780.1 n/a (980) ;mRNA; f:24569-27508